jgi:hypothetical protein
MDFLDELRALDSDAARDERARRFDDQIVQCIDGWLGTVKYLLRKQVEDGIILLDSATGKRYVEATLTIGSNNIPFHVQMALYPKPTYPRPSRTHDILARSAELLIGRFVSSCNKEGLIGSGKAGENYREPVVISARAYIDL